MHSVGISPDKCPWVDWYMRIEGLYKDEKREDSHCPPGKKRRITFLKVKVKVSLANCVTGFCPKTYDTTVINQSNIGTDQEFSMEVGGECVSP